VLLKASTLSQLLQHFSQEQAARNPPTGQKLARARAIRAPVSKPGRAAGWAGQDGLLAGGTAQKADSRLALPAL